MALTKEIVNDKIEVMEDGTVNVRTATRILEDGVIVAQSYHRKAISPIDVSSEEADDVKNIIAAVQTDAVKTKYRKKLKDEIKKLEGK